MLLHERRAATRCCASGARNAAMYVAGMSVERTGREQREEVDAEAVPVDLAQARHLRRHRAARDVERQRVAELHAERLARCRPRATCRRPRPAWPRVQNAPPDDRVALGQRVRPRQVELALGEAPRARVGELRRVDLGAVHRDEPPAHHRPERHVAADAGLQSCARASATCSGSTLIRNWLGASGGRLARQLRMRSPRTTVSSSSAIRPSASAPICRLDAKRAAAQVGQAEAPRDAALRQLLQQREQQPTRPAPTRAAGRPRRRP